MGMDLIVHIVQGPTKLVASAEAQKLVDNAVRVAKAYIDNYVDDSPKGSDEAALLEAVQDVLSTAYTDVESADEAAHAVQDMAGEWLAAFCEAWPDLPGRDVAWRRYGDEVVVVVGDSSYGDSPDGAGYNAINQLFFVKGLDVALGIK